MIAPLATGDQQIDVLIRIIIELCFFATYIWTIVNLYQLFQEQFRRYGRTLHVQRNRRWISFFLVVGVLACVLVQVIRCQDEVDLNRDKELTSADVGSLQDAMWGKDGIGKGLGGLTEMPNGLAGRSYQPRIHGSGPNLSLNSKRKMKRTLAWFKRWAPWTVGASKRRLNEWLERGVLVDTARKHWWVQQWYVGWMAWSLFVGTICSLTDMPKLTPLLLSIVASEFSLAGAQSLFFALLLIWGDKTRIRHAKWVPNTRMLTIIFLAGQAMTAILPTRKASVSALAFEFIQHVPIEACCLLAWLPRKWTGRKPSDVEDGQKSHMKLWTWIAIASFISQLQIGCLAFLEARADTGTKWHWFDHYPRRGSHGAAGWTDFHSAVWSGLNAFEYDPRINAIGCDVLLSLLSVTCWTLASVMDVNKLLKPTLLPQLTDGTLFNVDLGKLVGWHRNADKESRLKRQDEDRVAKRRWDLRGSRSRETQSPDDGVVEGKRRTRSANGSAKRSSSRKASRSPAKSGRRAATSRSRERSKEPVKQKMEFVVPESSFWSAQDLETAGLSLCLFFVGGLGMASAAVFGAEILG